MKKFARIFLIIQCDKHKNVSSTDPFSSLSLLALKIYANFISQRLENAILQNDKQRLQTRTIDVLENFSDISEEYYLRKLKE